MKETLSRVLIHAWVAGIVLFPVSGVLNAAPTVVVTPASVSNTYSGEITLQITGLASGEQVAVQKYLNLNGNTVVDANEPLVDAFKIGDGGTAIIGGVTNINAIYDRNSAAGAITVKLGFAAPRPLDNMVGKYLFRVSSPTTNFTAVTNAFAVTNAALAQALTGVVYSNGVTPVPNAVVVALRMPENNYEAAAVADASGHYNLKLAPGNYGIMPTLPGYYTDQSLMAQVTLASGVSTTNALFLTNGTVTVSGTVSDTVTSNLLGGVFVMLNSATGNLFCIAFADSKGVYSASVTPGVWTVRADASRMTGRAYVVPQNSVTADTTGGSVTNADIGFYKADALFFGVITNVAGTGLANISFSAYDAGGRYDASGYSDTNGNYSVAVVGGTNWYVSPDSSQPGLMSYVVGGGFSTNILAGEAIRQDFAAIPATNTISGHLWDGSHAALVGVGMSAAMTTNGLYFQTAEGITDGEGFYSLNVANGIWVVNVNCEGGQHSLNNQGHFQCPYPQLTNILNADAVIDFTAEPCGAPQIVTTNLPDGMQYAFYSMQLQVNGCNPPFIWSLLSGSLPSGIILDSSGNLSGTPTNSGSFEFTALVMDSTFTNPAFQVLSLTINPLSPLQIDTSSPLPNATNGTAYAQQLEAIGGMSPYAWSLSPASPGLPANLSLSTNGLISGTLGTNGLFNFSVKVRDQLGTNVDRGFSIWVTNPPVVITTHSLPVAVVTIPYTNHLQATGGQPPYTWSLAGGSDALPADLTLTSGGLLSGMPGVGGSFNLIFMAMDMNSVYATQAIVLTIGVMPAISQQPTNLTVPAGTNATFSVTASGSSPLTYQWQKGTNALANSGHLTGVDSNVFTLHNATPLDIGTYFVIVSNAYGHATSSNATLAVTVVDTNRPGLVILSPTSGQRVTNSQFTLTGTATDDVAVATIWYQLNSGTWSNAIGTTNWSATVGLSPGPNSVKAYAMDSSGNLSPTGSVGFASVQYATLVVVTNGHGTVTPNLNGQSLEIGQSSGMRARAGAGFAFTNWSSNLSGVLTNKPSLIFVMQSNLVLTANFRDVIRPTLIVTAPKAGQRTSNAVFTVSGRAKDNVAVAAVVYRLNGAAWTNAAGTTNWSAGVTLVPGTNLLSICAVDTSTNYSATNTIRFVYIVSAPLTVQIVGGRGTLAPNYNGKLLAVSNSYSMTARPAGGFAFRYWSGGVPMTNKATLRFMMQSNLVIIANFKDIQRPVNAITVPAVNHLETNTPLTAAGKAKDNVGVSNVWYRLNSGEWNAAVSGNGYTNWTASGLDLISGGNLLQSYALDAADNASLTNSVKFKYTVAEAADWAPDSLNGLVVRAQLSNDAPVIAAFDISTFSKTGDVGDTNAGAYSLGNYGYLKTGTNTAQLVLTNTAPPAQTNSDPFLVHLLFTNHYTGIFTNADGEGGTLSASVAGGFAPVTVAGRMLVATKSGGRVTLTLKNNGTFTLRPGNPSGTGTATGTYAFSRFSPVGALLVLNYTDASHAGHVDFVQAAFSSASAGRGLVTSYDNTTNAPSADAVTFVLR